MTTNQLEPNEYATFYAPYIKALGNVELITELAKSSYDFLNFIHEIPNEKLEYRYEEGKWTIKDIVQHIIDAERIFAYRALRIARQDKTPLPGFEENAYADQTNANSRNVYELITEFRSVRTSTQLLFESFTDEQLLSVGIASDKEVSVRAIGFILLGHQKHHQRIITERYL